MKRSLLVSIFVLLYLCPVFGSTFMDSTTGLTWENSTHGPMNWQDALDYCADLSLDGHSDWRLASITELQSLVNYGMDSPASAQPDTHSAFYWSGTTNRSSAAVAWGIDFNDGDVITKTKTNTFYVRAVRGQAEVRPDLGNGGTYTDDKTGLIWQQETSGLITWEAAMAYCQTLVLGGKNDWRLPNITELQSLVAYDQKDPAINVWAFQDTVSGFYWSTTTNRSSAAAAWGIDFDDGDVITKTKTNTFYVRAVRGQAEVRPDLGNGGTYTDDKTGLIWQQETSGLITWEAAMAYCQTLVLGGKNDWRLPNITELQSLVAYDQKDPAINVWAFQDTVSGFYWSTTTNRSSAVAAWGIDFDDGDVITKTKTDSFYIRAVRDGAEVYSSYLYDTIQILKTIVGIENIDLNNVPDINTDLQKGLPEAVWSLEKAGGIR